MATYRLSVQVISRGQGRDIIAAAAYRAAAKLFDERTGLTSNYESKVGVEHTEIIAPENAPAWATDRQRLWNEVSWSENRRDARLAREVQVSLPAELSAEAQLELTRTFVRDTFVAQGMVADVAIHRADDGNPHAHILLTTRTVTAEGFTTKERDWNRTSLLFEWREAWETAANRALALEGHDARIDCRSYEDRGMDLAPQPKLYRQERDTHLDGRDHVLQRSVELVRTRRRNGERLAADPQILLDLVTCSGKKPTFALWELEQAADKNTADTTQYGRVLEAALASAELVPLRRPGTDEVRYTTRAILEQERALLREAQLLATRGNHAVPRGVAEQAIRDFPAIVAADYQLSEEQGAAVQHITSGGDFAIVEGYAGTGKSTMLGAARVAWEAQGLTVVGGALAGKAADGLAEAKGAGIPSRTLASWLWNWERGKERLTSSHVLVIDEAGMVGNEQLAQIAAEVRAAGAKLVLVGDTRQLQAIEPGAPMRLLQKQYGAATLSQINRQRSHEWQKRATLKFATGAGKEALKAYAEKGRVHAAASTEAAHARLVADWAQASAESPKQTSIMLAFRRADVRSLNEKARSIRMAAGELGPSHLAVKTEDGDRHFARADRIYFLKNDTTLGVKNGTLGTIAAIDGAKLAVSLDDGRQVVVDTAKYTKLDHGYAGTIHKSQGVTVDRAYVFASRYMDSAASYVAMSRHRDDAHLYFSEAEFATAETMISRITRDRSVESAHEVGGEQTVPTKHQPTSREAVQAMAVERKLEAHEAFLRLSPTDQLAKLEALRLVGARAPLKVEQIVDQAKRVQAAHAEANSKEHQLEGARRALVAFEATHPLKVRLNTAEYRAIFLQVSRLHRASEGATATLEALRADPQLREKARVLAADHNRKVRLAQLKWRELQAVQQQAVRSAALARFVEGANRKVGRQVVTPASSADIGKVFDQIAAQKFEGADIVLLRDRATSRVIVAWDDECGDSRGARTFGGRERNPQPKQRERGRSGPER